MKLHVLGPVVITLTTAMITGCGPGMTPRTKAPTDVLQAMDAELSHTLPGTTTLTSATLDPLPLMPPLPESRMSLARAFDDTPPTPAVQTWGASAELPADPKLSEYGF
jgi:hypothetical protein